MAKYMLRCQSSKRHAPLRTLSFRYVGWAQLLAQQAAGVLRYLGGGTGHTPDWQKEVAKAQQKAVNWVYLEGWDAPLLTA